jgi:omega-hydroxy-beta-dihydromenaquinone-9 sulfotransferase
MSSGAWSRPVFNLNLQAWRRMRARHPDPIGRALEMRFYLAGSVLSALATLQERIYQPSLGGIDLHAPIFIVGHWRSGTTLLHELLALDSVFAVPTTYACFNPQHFLLSRHRAPARAEAARPADDMVISPFSPQEDDFALLCLGAATPYETFMFPSALRDVELLSDPERMEGDARLKWDKALTWTFRATAYACGAERRILSKSPPHSFRIERLRALFPGAAFVRMVREPCAVFASTMRMWETMWQRYALTAPLGGDLLAERVLETGRALERKLETGLRSLSPERTATIRYEDLIADPEKTIAHLYERLALGDPHRIRSSVAAYMAQNSHVQTRDTARWRPLVQEQWSEMFEQFGYARH